MTLLLNSRLKGGGLKTAKTKQCFKNVYIGTLKSAGWSTVHKASKFSKTKFFHL